MNIRNSLVWASLMLATGSFATDSLAREIGEPGFKVSAKRVEQPTKHHLKASGGVVLSVYGTEIRSDKMDVFKVKNGIRVVAGKFRATIEK